MFLAFLSLAVIGSLLLLTVIAFYNKKDSSNMQSERRAVGYGGPAMQKTATGGQGNASLYGPSMRSVSSSEVSGNDAKERGEDKKGFVPVILKHGEIPGVRERELVHFIDSGTLFFIESEQGPEEMDIDTDELTMVLEGNLVLTSKQIIVFNKEASKRILISSIAKHRFTGSFLIIKRKRVKKKTDVIKISRRPVEFSYILHTLL